MKLRGRLAPAVAVALALPALTACLAGAASAPSGVQQNTGSAAATNEALTEAAERTVIIDCLNKLQVRPGSFVLTCADGNDYLTGLTWTSWTSTQAQATGREWVNDCQPDCAQGHSHRYPVLAVFSHPAAVANHPGEKHFSKLTLHYPGARPPQYKNGKQVPGPKTVTLSLWSKMP
jgi:hypothetical protein